MDIKYDHTGDIDLSSGDLRYTDGTEQHKLTILLASKGELKRRPDIGVGIANFLLNNEPGELLREARRHCQRAGMRIDRVYFDQNNNLFIEGNYDNSIDR